ncbi:hypothetical protein QOT17_021669 [Balamuthia mandrillaris]
METTDQLAPVYARSDEAFCLFRELDPELACHVLGHLVHGEEDRRQRRATAVRLAAVCRRFHQLIHQDPALHVLFRRFAPEGGFKATDVELGVAAQSVTAAVTNRRKGDKDEKKFLVFGGAERDSAVNVLALAPSRKLELTVYLPDKPVDFINPTTHAEVLLALLHALRLSVVNTYSASGQLLLFGTAPEESILPGEQREAVYNGVGTPFLWNNPSDHTIKTCALQQYPSFSAEAKSLRFSLGCLAAKGHQASDRVIDLLLANGGESVANALPKELGSVKVEAVVHPAVGGSIRQINPQPAPKEDEDQNSYVPPPTGVRGLCLLDASGQHDRFFVYGGSYTKGQVFCWNVEEEQWDKTVATATTPPSSSSSQPSSSSTVRWTPERREGHSMVAIGGRYLWVFGGVCNQDFCNDLLVFDTHNLTWRKVVAKNPPPPRAHHTAIVWKDKIFVFGGIGKVMVRKSMVMARLEQEKAWSSRRDRCGRVSQKTNTPEEKHETEDPLVLSTEVLNDVHVFDTKDEEAGWQRVETKGLEPKPRAHHAASELHGFMVVTCGRGKGFMGYNAYYNLESLSDCLVLDLLTMEWKRMPWFESLFGHGQVVLDECVHVIGGYLDISRKHDHYNGKTVILQPNFA